MEVAGEVDMRTELPGEGLALDAQVVRGIEVEDRRVEFDRSFGHSAPVRRVVVNLVREVHARDVLVKFP